MRHLLFNEDFSQVLPAELRNLFGHCEVPHKARHSFFEREKDYFLGLDLPGVSKEKLSIEVEENILKIEATRRSYSADMKERETHFSREFVLPEDINLENVNAEIKDGFLTIKVEKEVIAPRKIKVSVG